MASRREWNSRPGRSSRWIRPERRNEIYKRDNYTCVWCGANEVPLTLDHLVPRHRGGTNETKNLVTACLSCNSRRRGIPIRRFAAMLSPDGFRETMCRIKNARRRLCSTREE
jgi:5-methylcytosine-specific restriction endonuclease McrA